MTPPLRSLALAALLAAPLAVRAATPVVLLPATGANVPEPELAAATDVLRAELEATGAFTVTAGDAPGGAVPELPPAQAGAAAASHGAELAVSLRISRVGRTAMARLTAIRPDGTVGHADQLSSQDDDLDVLLRRLAKGLAGAGPAAKNADVDSVTAREAEEPRRRPAVKGFGVRLGGAWFVDRPGSGRASTLTTTGVFWQYDGRGVLADVALEGGGGDGDAYFAPALGVYLPIGRTNVAPYVGGGAALLLVGLNGQGGSGMDFRAAAGLLVNRLSRLQFRVEGGYRVAAYTVRAEGERGRAQGPYVWGAIVF